MKLNLEEKHVIEKISVISGKDKVIVKDILKSLLFMTTIETFAQIFEEKKKLVIPYIGTIIFDWSIDCERSSKSKKMLNFDIQFEEADAFADELTKIEEGDITPTQDFIQKRVF